MPVARGVSKDFIELLKADALAARTRVIVSIVLLVGFLGLGMWLWWPWGAAVHIGGAALGFALGWFLANGSVGGYERSLRGAWNRWMDLSPNCDTVSELGRRVHRRHTANRAYVVAAALTLFWALEVLLVVLAFTEDAAQAYLSGPVIGANAAMAALLLGHQVRFMAWTREFGRSLAEMVSEGEIGVWGVS